MKERLELQVPYEVKRQLVHLSFRTGLPMSDLIIFAFDLLMDAYTQTIGQRTPNVNDPQAYEAAMDSIGLEFAEQVVKKLASMHQSDPDSVEERARQAKKAELQKQLRFRPEINPNALKSHA